MRDMLVLRQGISVLGGEEETSKYHPRLQVVPMQCPYPAGSPGFSKVRVLDGK